MPNVYDIAKAAGVSRSTVSRIINNQSGVKEEKRIKVLEVIERLNYTPNAMARDLALKKTNTIGVFVKELSNVFFSGYIGFMHYIADHKGYGAVYCNRNSFIESNIDYLSFLNKKVDGLIFLGENTVTKKELESLVSSEYPVVAIQFTLDVPGVTYITIDNYKASYQAVEYLIELGHKKIINVCGPKDFEFLERNRGYSQAVLDHDLSFQHTYFLDYYMKSAYNLVHEIASTIKEQGITAAVCSNNTLATGLIDGLIDIGIRVPEDFSVIGFDDIVTAEVTNNNVPAITSVQIPQKEISEYAVIKLLLMMETGIGDYSQVFECQLMKRKSTAKCQ